MQTISHVLKSSSRVLGEVPSMGYAMAYLLCIPIFGVLFWSVSDSFYHSTVQFEKNIDEDADSILQELSLVIKDSFKEVHGDYVAYENDWGLWISEIQLNSLRPTDSNLSFKMRLQFRGRNSKEGMESYVPLEVSVDNTEFIVTQDQTTKKWMHYREVRVENEKQLPVSLKFIFPQDMRNTAVDTSGLVPLLSLSQELINRITGFQNSVKGFPAKASGTLGRMLYLSSVTITTLGYGDIVPISGVSRFLVGLESVLGIVLIGLFLNSLSRENKDA